MPVEIAEAGAVMAAGHRLHYTTAYNWAWIIPTRAPPWWRTPRVRQGDRQCGDRPGPAAAGRGARGVHRRAPQAPRFHLEPLSAEQTGW